MKKEDRLKIILKLLMFVSVLIIYSGNNQVFAQKAERIGGIVEFDKTVHDFGDIMLSQGAVKCEYKVKNISEKPIVIYNVVSSCGCTDVKWTRKPLNKSETGKIMVTYKNNEGAYPFDKMLTVYISGMRKPIVLHLRGVCHKKKPVLEEQFRYLFGNLAIKEYDIKSGNMNRGQCKSGELRVANLGKKALSLSFTNVDKNLKLEVESNPIPAGKESKLYYTIKSDGSSWGRTYYFATPLCNGKEYKMQLNPKYTGKNRLSGEVGAMNASRPRSELGIGKSCIGIWSFIKEDFSNLTRNQKDDGPLPSFTSSYYSFGTVKEGTVVDAEFVVRNDGKQDFIVYKTEFDNGKSLSSTTGFEPLKPGQKRTIKYSVDTEGLPKGETLILLTLVTNSPLRPFVNLYVTGWIK